MKTDKPKKPTLFDLDGQELELLSSLEALFAEPMNPDIDPGAEAEALVDAHLEKLAEVQGQLQAKLEGYCKFIKAKQSRAALLVAEAKLYQLEAQRLADRAHGEEDTANFLQLRLKAFLERRGLKEFVTTTHKLKIVSQGGKVALMLAPGITPDQVDPAFTILTDPVPAQRVFDKQKIEEALKSGGPLVLAPKASDEDEASQAFVWARFADRPTKLKIS